MKTHYCIYQPGQTNIQTACLASDGEALKSPFTGKLYSDLLVALKERGEA